ncbi:DUF4179 domain-containing protein [Pontibacillus salicampi]|uniref:DUF4179 domain-containing protein n=1 Tax=Pontibacillus salicampi TaxID=1449801 RepID=A0ABV6LLY3_9BACI
MEQWEKILKKQTNEELPKEVEEKIDSTLSSLTSKKPRRAWKYGISVAAVLLAFMVGTASLSPTIAQSIKTIPMVESVMKLVGSITEKEAAKQNLTVSIGEEVAIDGKTITFTESFYDGTEVHISYVVSGVTDQSKGIFSDDLSFEVNGEEITNYGYGVGGSRMDETTEAGTISITINNLPESFTLAIKHKEDDWQVSIPVEKKGEETFVPIHQEAAYKELTMNITSVSFTPTTTRLQYNLVYPEQTNIITNEKQMLLQVEDEQGRVLRHSGASGSGYGLSNGLQSTTEKVNLERIDGETPKTLTIKPYIMDFQSNQNKAVENSEAVWKGESVTLSQGEMGSLTVTEVLRNGKDIEVIYEVQGEDAATQSSTFWLEDKQGNYIEGSRGEERLGANTFKQTFYDVGEEEELIFKTAQMESHEYIQDLEFTITVD